MAGRYRIDAVRYARRDTIASEVFHRDTAHAPIGMDYFVRALTDGARTVVVDFGFTEAVGTARGRTFPRCPSHRLAELGIDCARVDDVIVSHFHYDHVGNYALFPPGDVPRAGHRAGLLHTQGGRRHRGALTG